MSKQDDILEERLRGIDGGAQPGQIHEDEEGSSQAASLVSLAASIRDISHPELDQQSIESDKRRLISAAREKYQADQKSRVSNNGRFSGQWLFVPAFAGVALILLMVFVLAAGAGLYFSGPRGAQAAILTDASGVLEISDTAVSGVWHEAENGDKVRTGQRIRTGDASWVTLEFFDGTRTRLAPNTDLVLNKIDGNWGNELQVELVQNRGQTDHQVIPLQGDQAAYHVLTPSGEASVKGTTFSVLVEETGLSLFKVETGEVLVTNDGNETSVLAGQGVITDLGVPLSSPAYLFILQGELEAKGENTWRVNNAPFTVRDETIVVGNPEIGDLVLVNGRIKNSGEWVADIIQTIAPGASGGAFTGVVMEQNENTWRIGGFDLQVNQDFPDIEIGDLVRVTFIVEGGIWVAVSIDPVDDDNDEPEPDPEPEPEPDHDSELFFSPGEGVSKVCEPIQDFITSLNYVTEDPEAQAVEVVLVANAVEGGELIKAVTFSLTEGPTPLGPENKVLLEPGVPVGIMVTVELNEILEDPETENEIKIQVSILVDGVAEDEFFRIKLECEVEDPDETPDDGDGDKCTRAEPHPKALKLEAAYGELVGVTYDQIWEWFCEDNLGFGEIELGFKLYLEYEEVLPMIEGVTTVDDIFAMGLGGLGWGQVKHEMAKLAREALPEEEELSGKKEPPGKQKSEDAKNKEKPNKKNQKDD